MSSQLRDEIRSAADIDHSYFYNVSNTIEYRTRRLIVEIYISVLGRCLPVTILLAKMASAGQKLYREECSAP